MQKGRLTQSRRGFRLCGGDQRTFRSPSGLLRSALFQTCFANVSFPISNITIQLWEIRRGQGGDRNAPLLSQQYNSTMENPKGSRGATGMPPCYRNNTTQPWEIRRGQGGDRNPPCYRNITTQLWEIRRGQGGDRNAPLLSQQYNSTMRNPKGSRGRPEYGMPPCYRNNTTQL